ncbi:MAG: hypothetical protein AB1486_17360 [Planctomycetota bacterium]
MTSLSRSARRWLRKGLPQVIEKLRGSPGEEHQLLLERDGKELDVTIRVFRVL